MTKPTLTEVIKSVVSAAVGIQSDAKRERDFKNGSIGIYLLVGGIATILFIGFIVMVVSVIV